MGRLQFAWRLEMPQRLTMALERACGISGRKRENRSAAENRATPMVGFMYVFPRRPFRRVEGKTWVVPSRLHARQNAKLTRAVPAPRKCGPSEESRLPKSANPLTRRPRWSQSIGIQSTSRGRVKVVTRLDSLAMGCG